MEKNTKKLGNKIMIFCIIFAVALSVFIGWLGYNTYKSNILERYQIYTKTLLDTAETYFDGNDIKDCIISGKASEKYDFSREIISNIKENSEVSYIYSVYFPDKNDKTKMNYIMNAVTKKDLYGKETSMVISNLGEECEQGAFDENMINSFWNCIYNNKGGIDYIINDTKEYGYQMTKYTSIKDSYGNGICVLAVDISMNKIKDNIHKYLLKVTLGTSALLIVFLIIFIRVINKTVINPVNEIALNAYDFVNQTYTVTEPSLLEFKKVEVNTKDEIEMLAKSLENMTSEIKVYMENLKSITAEKERISAELNVATNIQASMLPCIFPAFPERDEFDIYATMSPAKEVGGDFYDFFFVDNNHLCITIADVSGKGVPAALFMVIAKTLLKDNLLSGKTPEEVFTSVNNQLCENNKESMFVTAWMGVLEITTGKFTYVNAGHNPPLIKRGDKGFEFLKSRPGFVLAGVEGINYKQEEIKLSKDNVLYMYTDGVTEASNSQYKLYGEERLKNILNTCDNTSPKYILEVVKNDINKFVAGEPQFDDITMLSLKLV